MRAGSEPAPTCPALNIAHLPARVPALRTSLPPSQLSTPAACLPACVAVRRAALQVFCVAFSPDLTKMVTASGDGLLKVWNINVRYHMDEDPKCILSTGLSLLPGKCYSRLAWGPEGLVAGVCGTTLHFIDSRSGEVVDRVEDAHDAAVSCGCCAVMCCPVLCCAVMLCLRWWQQQDHLPMPCLHSHLAAHAPLPPASPPHADYLPGLVLKQAAQPARADACAGNRRP